MFGLGQLLFESFFFAEAASHCRTVGTKIVSKPVPSSIFPASFLPSFFLPFNNNGNSLMCFPGGCVLATKGLQCSFNKNKNYRHD